MIFICAYTSENYTNIIKISLIWFVVYLFFLPQGSFLLSWAFGILRLFVRDVTNDDGRCVTVFLPEPLGQSDNGIASHDTW